MALFLSSDQTPFAKAVSRRAPGTEQRGLAGHFRSLMRITFRHFREARSMMTRVIYGSTTRFNQKLSIFGVYSQHQTAIFDPPTFGGAAGGNANSNVHLYNRQIAFGATYLITPTSLFDFRIGIGHNEGGKSPYGLGSPEPAHDEWNYQWYSDRSHHRSQLERAECYWVLTVRDTVGKPAVPEPLSHQPEGELHVHSRYPFDEGRLRVSSNQHTD